MDYLTGAVGAIRVSFLGEDTKQAWKDRDGQPGRLPARRTRALRRASSKRAIEDRPGPPLKNRTSELGGIIGTLGIESDTGSGASLDRSQLVIGPVALPLSWRRVRSIRSHPSFLMGRRERWNFMH